MKQIQAAELKAWLTDTGRGQPILVDVREPWEFRMARIESATLIPIGEVPTRLAEIDPAQDIVVICHHGARSMQVAGFLKRQGFPKVYNLAGGVAAWARAIDPSMPVY